MNISIQKPNLLNGPMLKSTQDRIERQSQRDGKIAFFEKQKENLKDMTADTLEEISRKLSLLQGYNDQIAAAKAEYNHSQVFHVLDEAREMAEKIAEEAEKYASKTPEERIEDIIEEATSVEKDEGMLDEMLEEINDSLEEIEDNFEELDEMAETMEAQVEESDMANMIDATKKNRELLTDITDLSGNTDINSILDKYKRIDIRV